MPSAADVAITLLRGQGMRMTPQRIAIVTEVMTSAGYAVPTTVIRRIQERFPGVSPSTVYRTLERLEQVGVLTHVHLDTGVGYHRIDETQHAHLTCSSCGTEHELDHEALAELERVVQRRHGFRPDFTHSAISGLCAECEASGRRQPQQR